MENTITTTTIQEKKLIIEDIICSDGRVINYLLHVLLGNGVNLKFENTEKGISIKIFDGFNMWDGHYIDYYENGKTIVDLINRYQLTYYSYNIIDPIKNDELFKIGNISTPYHKSFVELQIDDCFISFDNETHQFEIENTGKLRLEDYNQLIEQY